MGLAVLLALGLAACGDEGGELRDATARRRAEGAGSDTAGDDANDTLTSDTSFRLPVFVDTAAVAARTDSARADSARAAEVVATDWTAGVRQTSHPGVSTTLRGLRVAANQGFDRLVLDFGPEPVPGWRVEYLDQPVTQCGSGEPVPLGAGAALRVQLRYTQAHDEAGRPTIRQRDLALDMPVMRRMVITCDFEGEVEVALGTASAQPYRVTELHDPSRLVIDIRQPAAATPAAARP